MPRSLKVRHELIPTVKAAVRRSGFSSQRMLAEELNIALSTVSNFLTGKPVDLAVFGEICDKLSLEADRVADLSGRESAQVSSSEADVASNPPEAKLTETNPEPNSNQPTIRSNTLHPNIRQDWGESPDVSVFYGRDAELTTLERWIRHDYCRMVAILGMGGMGKTALVTKLAERIQDEFEYVIWRSLRNAPPVLELLADLIRFLSRQQEVDLSESIDYCVLRLIHYLRNQRCLLILDNAESVLQSGDQAGQYLTGYEGYGQLLRTIGDTVHQSCLLLTSREKPKGFSHREGKAAPVRSFQLAGLSETAGQEVIKRQGTLFGSDSEWQMLIQHYAGNPLALKMVASGIEDFLDGNIAEFLQYVKRGTLVFGNIRDLLERQFQRLSDLEIEVMYWLAINREPVTAIELQNDLVLTIRISELLAALASLQRRSLIESFPLGFTQQPVVMEFVTEQLLLQVYQELTQETAAVETVELPLLRRYALVKATAKDYIRDTQIRLILEPLSTLAIQQLGTIKYLEDKLRQWLDYLRNSQTPARYAAGNIIHLLHQLSADLTGIDLSHLQIWQANLAGLTLHQANLSHAQIAKSVFAETFGGISSVAFNPSGELLAACDTGGGVQIWQLATGKRILAIEGRTAWAWSVVFSPNGQLLVSCSDIGIRLWNIQANEHLQTFIGHTNTAYKVVFSPNSRILASCSADTTIKLWQVGDQSGSSDPCLLTLEGHQDSVWSIDFSPDGQTIVSGASDHTLRLWNVSTGACERILQGHTGWVRSVAFSPDGKFIVSGSTDCSIKLWDVETGQCINTLQGHQDTVTTVAFSPDGQQLASSSYDQTIKFWDIPSGQCIRTLQEHSNRVWVVAFSPNGQYLASGGDDHAVRLWEIRTGKCIKTWKGHTNSALALAINHSHHLLISGHEDETIRLWNLQTGAILKTLRGHTHRVFALAFAPPNQTQLNQSQANSALLASGSGDRTIKLWNWQTGECVATLRGHTSWVWFVVFSPDGEWLASSSTDGTIKLWDVKTGLWCKTLEGHVGPVAGITFSPDGQWLISGGLDRTIKIWQINTGECLKTLQGHQHPLRTVLFNPQTQQLITSSYDRTIKFWNISSGECTQTLIGHNGSVLPIALSAGGQYLASGSLDQTIRVWDTSSSECIQILQGHKGIVVDVLFCSTDILFGSTIPESTLPNEVLLSGSFDETIKMWDINTGECLKTLRAPRPYEKMNITNITGLTEAEKENLKYLGAIEK
jgi:WD40 repeat protein